jgi:hypothetical protein
VWIFATPLPVVVAVVKCSLICHHLVSNEDLSFGTLCFWVRHFINRRGASNGFDLDR